MKTRWYEFKNKAESVSVDIFDEIGGWGYTSRDLVNLLGEVGNKEINITLNSPGGDIFEGLALYDKLSKIDNKVNIEVTGLAASIASVVMLAGNQNGNTLKLTENAMVMIHNAWTVVGGNADELENTANSLRKAEDRIVNVYMGNFNIPESEIRDLMAKETFMSSNELVEYGVLVQDNITAGLSLAAKINDNWKEKYKYINKIGDSKMFNKKEMKELQEKFQNLAEQFESMKTQSEEVEENGIDFNNKFSEMNASFESKIKSVKSEIEESFKAQIEEKFKAMEDLKSLMNEIKEAVLKPETETVLPTKVNLK